MKVRHKTLVPRNPYAVAAAQKKAGKHVKTMKTQRQEAKKQLQKNIAAEKKAGNFPPFSLCPSALSSPASRYKFKHLNATSTKLKRLFAVSQSIEK